MPDIDELKSLPQLARDFGYASASTLRTAAIAGALQARKIGRNWVSTPAWVQEWESTVKTRGTPRGPKKPESGS